jgi:hypothetical protein
MSDFQKQLISDLAKKYTFETFNFSDKSPEDLLTAYQETFDKISKVIDEQNSEIERECTTSWLNSQN